MNSFRTPPTERQPQLDPAIIKAFESLSGSEDFKTACRQAVLGYNKEFPNSPDAKIVKALDMLMGGALLKKFEEGKTGEKILEEMGEDIDSAALTLQNAYREHMAQKIEEMNRKMP